MSMKSCCVRFTLFICAVIVLHMSFVTKYPTWFTRRHVEQWTSGWNVENLISSEKRWNVSLSETWRWWFEMREKVFRVNENQPATLTTPAGERASSKKMCTISIRLRSEGGNDEKIQFNVQLKFPSIFYLRLPSHCAKDGHSFFHLYDYEYKWVWFL